MSVVALQHVSCDLCSYVERSSGSVLRERGGVAVCMALSDPEGVLWGGGAEGAGFEHSRLPSAACTCTVTAEMCNCAVDSGW